MLWGVSRYEITLIRKFGLDLLVVCAASGKLALSFDLHFFSADICDFEWSTIL
jgi:hypothetical protein